MSYSLCTMIIVQPTKAFLLEKIEVAEKDRIAAGDFNSHSEALGYPESDIMGEEIEERQIDTKLLLK